MTLTSRAALDTGLPGRHHIDRRADAVAAAIAAGDPDQLFSTKELSRLTGLSEQFFEIGRTHGYGPHYLRLSTRRVRYRRADVLSWLASRTHASTKEYDNTGRGRKPGSRVVNGKVIPPAEAADAA
jgi:predicted DNA-binding transcriptional regulator AlpA